MLLMEGSLFQETIHLKELLIVNLDLVQQQQELLVEKDRKLHSLQQENESLKSRLERMGRRMSLCQTKQSKKTVPYAPASGDENLVSRLGRKSCSHDPTEEAAIDDSASPCSGQLKQHANNVLEHEPAKKIRIVSLGKGKAAARKVDVAVKSEPSARTRSSSPALKDIHSVPKSKSQSAKKGRSNNEILTTDSLYYVRKPCEENSVLGESEQSITDDSNVIVFDMLPGSSNHNPVTTFGDSDIDFGRRTSPELIFNPIFHTKRLAVPQWRTNVVHSLYVMEGTENLNDSLFLKRHQKSELEEKRRKRWDVQRLRDLHLLQKHQHKVGSTYESHQMSTDVLSLLPDPDRLSFIVIDDCIPVSAFGQALPNLQTSEFSLPWSELDTDIGKTNKVKKNSRKSICY